MAVERELLVFSSAAEWRAWLEVHGAESTGVQLALGKKGSGIPSVSYLEALETALCFGWIDGQRNRLDETHFRQLYTPRGPRSIWSQINRDRVQALIDAGLMTPAGLAEIDRAKADGRWEAAYAPASTITVPDDLAAALAASPAALALFEQLDSANRYAMLFRIANVKRAETRERKIVTYVEMLARGETLYPRKA